jgi:hypothetical protein
MMSKKPFRYFKTSTEIILLGVLMYRGGPVRLNICWSQEYLHIARYGSSCVDAVSMTAIGDLRPGTEQVAE